MIRFRVYIKIDDDDDDGIDQQFNPRVRTNAKGLEITEK